MQAEKLSLGQIQAFLSASETIRFEGETQAQIYHWIEQVLGRQEYHQQGRSAFNVQFAGTLGNALSLGTSRWVPIMRRPVLQFFREISYGLYPIHTLGLDVTGHFVTPVAMRLARPTLQGDFPLTLMRFLIGAMAETLIAFLSRRYF